MATCSLVWGETGPKYCSFSSCRFPSSVAHCALESGCASRVFIPGAISQGPSVSVLRRKVRSVSKLHRQVAPMDVAHVTRVEGPESGGGGKQLTLT
jgi:hypothetical protein